MGNLKCRTDVASNNFITKKQYLPYRDLEDDYRENPLNNYSDDLGIKPTSKKNNVVGGGLQIKTDIEALPTTHKVRSPVNGKSVEVETTELPKTSKKVTSVTGDAPVTIPIETVKTTTKNTSPIEGNSVKYNFDQASLSTMDSDQGNNEVDEFEGLNDEIPAKYNIAITEEDLEAIKNIKIEATTNNETPVEIGYVKANGDTKVEVKEEQIPIILEDNNGINVKDGKVITKIVETPNNKTSVSEVVVDNSKVARVTENQKEIDGNKISTAVLETKEVVIASEIKQNKTDNGKTTEVGQVAVRDNKNKKVTFTTYAKEDKGDSTKVKAETGVYDFNKNPISKEQTKLQVKSNEKEFKLEEISSKKDINGISSTSTFSQKSNENSFEQREKNTEIDKKNNTITTESYIFETKKIKDKTPLAINNNVTEEKNQSPKNNPQQSNSNGSNTGKIVGGAIGVGGVGVATYMFGKDPAGSSSTSLDSSTVSNGSNVSGSSSPASGVTKVGNNTSRENGDDDSLLGGLFD